MLKKMIASSLFLLPACGTDQGFYIRKETRVIPFDEYLLSNVDEPIRPHFAEFMEYCKLSSKEDEATCTANINVLKSVRLKRGAIDGSDPHIIGICEISSSERNVTLRSDYFDYKSIGFKALVWHELGHCLLNLDHINGNNSHIMNPSLPLQAILQSNWVFFMKTFYSIRANISKPELSMLDSHGEGYE